jgi:L-amino acid N-acyltransferase YncA
LWRAQTGCKQLVYIAGIDGEQTASVALHARFHFEKVGHFKQLGFKFDRWLDVFYMELMPDSRDTPHSFGASRKHRLRNANKGSSAL